MSYCWMNSLWPSDAIWRRKISSSFDQVMTYVACLVSSHFLNQCWLIVNWSIRDKGRWNIHQIQSYSCKKMNLYMLSAKCRPLCSGLKRLIRQTIWLPSVNHFVVACGGWRLFSGPLAALLLHYESADSPFFMYQQYPWHSCHKNQT